MQTEEILNSIFEKQKLLGLSNQQLADASGVPKPTIDRIKRKDTTNPSVQVVLDLAAAVGYQFGAEEAPHKGDGERYAEHMVRMYEDRIARLRSHYNMLIAEKNRWLTYAFAVIGGLMAADFVMVILLIVIIHL